MFRTNARSLAAQCLEKVLSADAGLDAIVTTNPVHIGYLCGYRSIQQDAGGLRQALIATQHEIRLVTAASDGPAALEVLNDSEAVFRYGEFFVEGDAASDFNHTPHPADTFGDALGKALNSLSVAPKRIGTDGRDSETAALVERQFPDASTIDARGVVLSARAVKLPGELALLRRASEITSDAIQLACSHISAGISELEIAAEISRCIVARGGIPRFLVVTSGERSSRVDAYASTRTVRPGDIVRLDIGCSVQGYNSDMARTYILGEPDTLQLDRYSALLHGETEQLERLKPGITAGDLFDTAIHAVRSKGMTTYRRNHCGHGIGLATHEFPTVSRGNDTLLVPGMVLSLETPYYQIGWGGMMIEDTAIVTETGCEVITTASRELVL